MLQDQVFQAGEADRWFERNASVLSGERVDWPLRMLEMWENPSRDFSSVLEVGCANGWRLEQCRKRFGSSRCVGVEPSAAAVSDGRSQFPSLDLREGLLSDIPVSSDTFDLVMVCFVFCWVDRGLLARAVAEVDRVVRDGGFLLLADFVSDAPSRRRYHHREGDSLFTYKQDHAAIFESLCTYRRLAQVTFAFDRTTDLVVQDPASDDRFVCSLLRKSLTGQFQAPRAPE